MSGTVPASGNNSKSRTGAVGSTASEAEQPAGAPTTPSKSQTSVRAQTTQASADGFTPKGETVFTAPLNRRAEVYNLQVASYRAKPSAKPLPRQALDERLTEYLAVTSPFLYGVEYTDERPPYKDVIPESWELHQAYGLAAAVMAPERANRLLPLFEARNKPAERFSANGDTRCVMVVQHNDEPRLHVLSQNLKTGEVTHIGDRNFVDDLEDFDAVFKDAPEDGWDIMTRIFDNAKAVKWIAPEALRLDPTVHGNKPLWWT